MRLPRENGLLTLVGDLSTYIFNFKNVNLEFNVLENQLNKTKPPSTIVRQSEIR